jgi:hypothetical protein
MDYNAIRDISLRNKKRASNFQDSSASFPAVITSMGGLTYRSTLGKDFAWILLFNLSEGLHIAYDPGRVNLAGTGTPVRVMRSPDSSQIFRWQIVGLDTNYIRPGEETPVTNYEVGAHAENHQNIDEVNIGSDPVYVWQPMLRLLKTMPGSSQTVAVGSFTYTYQGTRKVFDAQALSLAAYLPDSDEWRKVLIYLNKTTNLLVVVSGTAVTYGDALTDPVMPTGVDGIESALVTVRGDGTPITVAAIEDMRDFLSGGSGGGSPTAANQVYMSDDDSNPAWMTPITSDDGWLVNSNGDLLVQ